MGMQFQERSGGELAKKDSEGVHVNFISPNFLPLKPGDFVTTG